MTSAGNNAATQQVVQALPGTEAGPELVPAPYAAFRERRLVVKRWLESLGVAGIHSLHPTHDGGGKRYGRDIPLMRDASLGAGVADGELVNRQATTAVLR